jgi:hypothetical protein
MWFEIRRLERNWREEVLIRFGLLAAEIPRGKQIEA